MEIENNARFPQFTINPKPGRCEESFEVLNVLIDQRLDWSNTHLRCCGNGLGNPFETSIYSSSGGVRMKGIPRPG